MRHLTIAVLTALAFVLLIAESDSVKILLLTKAAAIVLGALDMWFFRRWTNAGKLGFYKFLMDE